MDGPRFDQLVRELLGSGSRRNLLQWVSALPLAGALAGILPFGEEAEARKGK